MKILIATIFLAITAGAFGEILPVEDSALIDGSGIPIHPDATFVYGNSQVGFRFATSESPESVRKWYLEQLKEWALLEDMGLWILYNGPKGLGFRDFFMSRSHVTVSVNECAMPIGLVSLPLSVVLAAILPHLLSVSVLHPVKQFSGVDGSVTQGYGPVRLPLVVIHHFTGDA